MAAPLATIALQLHLRHSNFTISPLVAKVKSYTRGLTRYVPCGIISLGDKMNLLKVERAFGSEEQCRSYLEKMRWPNGPKCPKCSADAWRLTKRFLYECSTCHHQFPALIGTIFEKTHLPLSLWFKVIYLMSESKKGMSACQIKRMFGIHYRSAWYLCHRVRTAMKTSDLAEKLMGVLEVDETYVGPRGAPARTPWQGQPQGPGAGHDPAQGPRQAGPRCDLADDQGLR